MARIFLSYRHGDTNAYAGWLFERLETHFGKGSVFMDVDTLSGGVDFDMEIRAQVEICDVLIALIGPAWLEARDDSGVRRLERKDDYVRLEIATVLERGALVVPVLTDGTQMPRAGDLPESLKSLASRHAVELRHKDFDEQITQLIAELRERVRTPRGFKQTTFSHRGAAVLILALGVTSAIYLLIGDLRRRSAEVERHSPAMVPDRNAAEQWESGSRGASAPEPVPPMQAAVSPEVEVAYWNSVKDTDDIELMRSYIAKYPHGMFLTLARNKVALLERQERDERLLAAGVVNDRNTGRMWTRRNTGDRSWKMAEAFCRELRLAGYSDWRLPSAEEMRTIYQRDNVTGTLEFSGRQIPIRTIPGFQLNFTHMWLRIEQVDQTASLFDLSDGDVETPFDPDDDRWRTRAICVREAR